MEELLVKKLVGTTELLMVEKLAEMMDIQKVEMTVVCLVGY